MKLLDIHESYSPLYLIVYVQRGFFKQVWRGSIAEGWYQPNNGKVASGKILHFLDRCAFVFRKPKKVGYEKDASGEG
jgi:hypothetical protein